MDKVPDPAQPGKVYGRVIDVKRLSRKLNLSLLRLSMDGRVINCILPDNTPIPRGGFVIAEGAWKQSLSERAEFEVHQITHLAGPASSLVPQQVYQQRAIELLNARVKVMQVVQQFFLKKEFLPVQSPVIVDHWVEGQTRPFKLTFHKNQPAFLTISTIIHHQLIHARGYGNIYEIARLFRRNTASSKNKLSEFTNVVIGMLDAKVEDLIDCFSALITEMHGALLSLKFEEARFPATIDFQRITYDELIRKAGLISISGHQFPLTVRQYMDDTFPCFVWVTGFPEHTRPFYVRSVNGKCEDCQLWFKGKTYLSAGGAIETDPEILARKIASEGKEVERFRFYLDTVETGMPPMVNIDMGIERFLGHFFEEACPADFAFFPRYSGNLSP